MGCDNIMNFDSEIIRIVVQSKIQRFEIKSTILGYANKTGPQGPAGPQGRPGEQGIPGIKGDKGDKGEQGIPGPQGPAGETGPQGPAGQDGTQGDPFLYEDFTPEQLLALTGPSGPQGIQGEIGPTGPQGDIGPQGIPGLDGASSDTLPIGAIMPYSGHNIPENWLLCDGRAVSRTEYSELFNIVNTIYGSGDGSTTFNVPDLKGRTIVGIDLTQDEFDTIGETGGAKTVTLDTTMIPAHTHELARTNQATAFDNEYGDIPFNNGPGNTTPAISSSVGGGQAHNNMPPYIIENYIIKAKHTVPIEATVVDNLTSESSTDALSAKQGKVLNENINNGLSGGTTGQFLNKKSNADYDTEWKDIDIPEQTQSDLAQEDDTQVDYVKNKHADYIKATLYEEDEEGEQIPIYEGTANEVFNLYLSMINDTYDSLYDEIDQKQDTIEDIAITIVRSQWRNNEVIFYTSDVTPESKLWYSPTNESYNDFVEAEIRMTEQGYGQVKFRCETTPEEDINIIIRRA